MRWDEKKLFFASHLNRTRWDRLNRTEHKIRQENVPTKKNLKTRFRKKTNKARNRICRRLVGWVGGWGTSDLNIVIIKLELWWDKSKIRAGHWKNFGWLQCRSIRVPQQQSDIKTKYNWNTKKWVKITWVSLADGVTVFIGSPKWHLDSFEVKRCLKMSCMQNWLVG